MRWARQQPAQFVMKPQREGGGNNIYGDDIVEAMQTLSREQRSAFILMQRIFPKKELSVLVRGGSSGVGLAVHELGVYSSLLVSEKKEIVLNKVAGHLVRTKMDGVDEGGVATGYAVLSSPLLTNTKWR
mmetsp:Transcript_7340/g.16419  ORF Transcript_7340/g.16419 Transcript_7340/m.16419 type:complete len:129 (+) Transcript_7340:1003-1389(+)